MLDLVRKAIYRYYHFVPMKNAVMSKRIFSLVVIVLIASVLWSAIVHACSDLSSMRAILQAPCDHNVSDEPFVEIIDKGTELSYPRCVKTDSSEVYA